MDNIVVIGSSSSLTQSLQSLNINLIKLGRSESLNIDLSEKDKNKLFKNIPLNEKLYVINSGYLCGKKIVDLERSEIYKSADINLFNVVLVSEYILNNNTSARIIIIGSESGKKGSFDTVYFLSKCALRGYVRERKVGENQQIVLISPSTIEDSRMTQNRKDLDRLNSYKSSHPKKRFLYMEEMAKLLASLLLEQTSYITNCEIEINGGKFARMS